jgi:hypothetical protein
MKGSLSPRSGPEADTSMRVRSFILHNAREERPVGREARDRIKISIIGEHVCIRVIPSMGNCDHAGEYNCYSAATINDGNRPIKTSRLFPLHL